MRDKIDRIAEAIGKSGKSVLFTGAGISTESGIPDYRSKGGIWEQYRPVYFDEFMQSKRSRIEYWRRKSELYADLKAARPNPAHLAIAELHRQGVVHTVVTQNIDGLHQAAGVPQEEVIELHGNTLRVRCMSCNAISGIEEAQQRIEGGDPAPECHCGGYLKPDTISFGQAMPATETKRAVAICSACDFLMVVGSTLLVQPASLLPGYAKNSGAFLAIVNLSETPYDDVCDVRIQGKAGEVLPEIATRTSEKRG